MPVYHDVAKKAEDPEVFRQIARELLEIPDADWRPWEEYVFLPAMLRYEVGYVYSEKERAKLAELCGFAEEVYGCGGMPVEQMVACCYRYYEDFRRDDREWIVDLYRRNAQFVRKRQIEHLAALCRLSGIDIAA